MDFALSPETRDTCQRISAFLDRHVIPLESDRANYDEGENIRLQPSNVNMKPIVVHASAVEIQGRVIGVLRKY